MIKKILVANRGEIAMRSFLGGLDCRLLASISKLRINRKRVTAGSITSSTYVH